LPFGDVRLFCDDLVTVIFLYFTHWPNMVVSNFDNLSYK